MKTFFLLLIVFCSSLVSAQTDSVSTKKNAVYIELVGKGFMTSINYKRVLKECDNNLKLSYHVGVGYFRGFQRSSLNFPIPLTFEIAKGKTHQILTSVSFTPQLALDPHPLSKKDRLAIADSVEYGDGIPVSGYLDNFYLFPSVGYRLNMKKSFFSINWYYFIRYNSTYNFVETFPYWGSINYGYKF